MTSIPAPQVLACITDIGFVPPLPVIQLRWPEDSRQETLWILPSGEGLRAALPERFGLHVRRQADDPYAITLVWDSTYRQWFSLRRHEIRGSSLGVILASLGVPLEYLLDQPIGPPGRLLPLAA